MTSQSPEAGAASVVAGVSIPSLEALRATRLFYVTAALVVGLTTAVYWHVFRGLYAGWTVLDSYYTHGFLIPPISLFFVWQKRETLLRTPIVPSAWGYVVLAGACVMLLLSDYLGLRIFAQISFVPMLAGLILVFLGTRHLALVWFPLVFLLFMIPIPQSITQSVSLRVKLLATESAVRLAHLCMLPLVRDGSYVHFPHWSPPNDQILVGEICGGLRSLIALLAFGTLMSYISKTRTWARLLILAVSGPVAIVSNITRIFGLCVVGYFWGGEIAAGTFHDVSGIMIFVVAFILMFSLEAFLRRVVPSRSAPDAVSPEVSSS